MRSYWIKAAIGIGALASATPALAANWVLAAGSKDANIYVDVDSITRSGSVVSAWEKIDYSIVTPVDDVWMRRVLYEFDCDARTSRPRESIKYDKDGNVIERFDFTDNDLPFKPVGTGTVAEGTLDVACTGAPKTSA